MLQETRKRLRDTVVEEEFQSKSEGEQPLPKRVQFMSTKSAFKLALAGNSDLEEVESSDVEMEYTNDV